MMGGTLPQDLTDAERTARLHALLRILLAGLPKGTTAPDVATALMYEVASIVGALCPDLAAADETLDGFCATAKAQIRQYGVGRMHP
jgi:hypothetical protein